ncbi:hypothetical protein Bca4012_020216 [Brassica carinata]
MASEGDFDSILAGLKSECTLAPCSDDPAGQGRMAERGEGVADEVGGDGAVEGGEDDVGEGGDGVSVLSSDGVEDESGAPRSTSRLP